MQSRQFADQSVEMLPPRSQPFIEVCEPSASRLKWPDRRIGGQHCRAQIRYQIIKTYFSWSAQNAFKPRFVVLIIFFEIRFFDFRQGAA